MKLTVAILALLAVSATDAGRRPRPRPTATTSATTTEPATATTTAAPAATTTEVSGLSEYAQQVLEAAQEAMSTGTCGRPANADQCTGSCYGEVESVYIEYVENDYRYIIANGIPDHTANEGAERPNPNEACENFVYMMVPANATLTAYVDNGLGPIGLAVTGGFIYNPLSNPDGVDDVAVLMEGSSFDNCNGHADQKCFYHYHDDVSCVSDSSDCPLVGYLRDGVPVYGYCSIDGTQLQSCYAVTSGDGNNTGDYAWVESADCHLDENNGFTFEDGSYGYVMTNSYPYTPPGYMAEASSVCYF